MMRSRLANTGRRAHRGGAPCRSTSFASRRSRRIRVCTPERSEARCSISATQRTRQVRQRVNDPPRPQAARLLAQPTKDNTHRNGEADLEQGRLRQMELMKLKVLQRKRHCRQHYRGPPAAIRPAALRQLEKCSPEEQLLLQWAHKEETDDCLEAVRIPDPMTDDKRREDRRGEPREEPSGAEAV